MRAAVFDCFSGIAGDMAMAALVDAGAPLDAIRAGLATLGLPAFAIETREVIRGGMRALHLDVRAGEERTYQPDEMRALIGAAPLPARAQARALAAVEALAAGEAAAHATPQPHFHEASGVDAVVDIVGGMLALEALGVEAAWCPVVTVGAGAIVKAAHGPLPASPGPAAANTLQRAGFPLRFVEAAHELVTPTGAAILAAVAKPGAVVLTPTAHGAGAGTFDPPGRPNALRVFIGETADGALADGVALREVRELAANIDDMPAQLLAHARDRLLAEGALDAWIEAIGMKKGRSAAKLCALARPEDEARLALLLMRETTTLGVRVAVLHRYEARRESVVFESSLGPVRLKARTLAGTVRAVPEFDDVRALAESLGLPALEVWARVEAEARGTQGGG